MDDADKRSHPRFMLRLRGGEGGYHADVPECGLLFCELQDISSGGLRGKLADRNIPGMPLRQGQEIELHSFVSAKLDFVEGQTGTIAWTNDSARQFGVRFHKALPKDDVEALIFHFTSIFS